MAENPRAPPPGGLHGRLAAAGLLPPVRLTLAVARNCNLRCQHCYVESSEDGSPEPQGGAIRRVLAEFADLGGRAVVLTGGEPLTRPDWLDLLAFACGESRFEEVRLQTNATLVDRAAADAIASLGCSRLIVQVSVEGGAADTHDSIRGPGVFARAARGVEALAAAGLASRVAVAFTEMRHNVEELPSLLEWLEGMGVRRLTSASVMPHGRAVTAPGVSPPEPSQYRQLLERYRADEPFRRRCRDWAEVAALRWLEGRSHPAGSVCTLVRNPYVSTDGRLYPCPLLHERDFAVDGALARPLAEVLAEGVGPWARLQRISRERAEAIPDCAACPGRAHCGGGCMGRAWAAHRSFLQPEDRCALRQEVYRWVDAP